VHEGGGEVVDGLGVRAGEVDEDDVGPAPRGDHAHRRLQPERAGALQRGVVQGLAGGQPPGREIQARRR
jgi:hypothetical protein